MFCKNCNADVEYLRNDCEGKKAQHVAMGVCPQCSSWLKWIGQDEWKLHLDNIVLRHENEYLKKIIESYSNLKII